MITMPFLTTVAVVLLIVSVYELIVGKLFYSEFPLLKKFSKQLTRLIDGDDEKFEISIHDAVKIIIMVAVVLVLTLFELIFIIGTAWEGYFIPSIDLAVVIGKAVYIHYNPRDLSSLPRYTLRGTLSHLTWIGYYGYMAYVLTGGQQ